MCTLKKLHTVFSCAHFDLLEINFGNSNFEFRKVNKVCQKRKKKKSSRKTEVTEQTVQRLQSPERGHRSRSSSGEIRRPATCTDWGSKKAAAYSNSDPPGGGLRTPPRPAAADGLPGGGMEPEDLSGGREDPPHPLHLQLCSRGGDRPCGGDQPGGGCHLQLCQGLTGLLVEPNIR